MWYSWQDKNKTDEERYLEDQLEQERQYRRDLEERQGQERQARREQWRLENDMYARQADTWPEALHKQAALFERESSQIRAWHLEDPEAAADFPDDMFGPGAAACRRALELWPEAEAAVADEISALEAKIAELRASIAQTVADRLDEENADDMRGWHHVANALRETDEEPHALHNWLYW